MKNLMNSFLGLVAFSPPISRKICAFAGNHVSQRFGVKNIEKILRFDSPNSQPAMNGPYNLPGIIQTDGHHSSQNPPKQIAAR